MKMRHLPGMVATVLALTAYAAEPPSVPAPGPTIEAFAAAPVILVPKLSPAGESYAGALSVNGVSVLAILPVQPGAHEPIYVPVGETNELMSWAWVNDDWLIMTLATTLKVEAEDFRVSRAFGVSARNGKFVPLAPDSGGQNAADILWIARDGSPRVLLAIELTVYTNYPGFYPEVFEVDVSNGHRSSRAKSREGVFNWYADGDGNVRIGIEYSDVRRSYRMFYRDRNGELFRIVDRAKAREGESLTVPAMFLPEAGKALAYSDASGFNALYELDLKTLELGREVYSTPGYDVEDFETDATNSRLVGVSYIDSRARIEWLDPVMSKTQRDLDKFAGPGRIARIVSSSRDQRIFVVHMGSAETPGAYYVLDTHKNTIARIAQLNRQLGDKPLAPVTSLRYKARDGLEIEAFLTLPRGREPKGLPLIVMPHGGPAARDEMDWDWWSQYLAHLGYAVIKPNYRGSTGYGTAFYEKGQGQWGLAMQDDLIDAIDHLAAAGTIDAKRVCIVGASYGGYAALRGAQRDGARYRCAISYAGVADIVDMMKYDSRFIDSGARRDYRHSNAPDLKSVSPFNFPEQFSIPVLLAHGKRDLTVPVRQSRAMYDKLSKAGKQVRYVEQPLGDHHFSRYEDRLQFLQEMTAFLKTHNPAD